MDEKRYTNKLLAYRNHARGYWVLKSYYNDDTQQDRFSQGDWFDTGDIATIDQNGFMTITDRNKDIIKSGGEWISSIDLENICVGHPDVANAALRLRVALLSHEAPAGTLGVLS